MTSVHLPSTCFAGKFLRGLPLVSALTHYAIPKTVQFNFKACTVWQNIHDAYTFFVTTKNRGLIKINQ